MRLAIETTLLTPNHEPSDLASENGESRQRDVVAFMTDPGNWEGQPVEQIETHISRVFLVGKRVYKMKRAVHLEFVDFSQLETRRIACEREVNINRKTAPDIYLRSIAIVKEGDTLILGGPGNAVEYLVEMERFDEETRFSRLVETKALSEGLICDLGEQVARFHLSAAATAKYGGELVIKQTLQGICATLARFEGTIFDKVKLAQWQDRVSKTLDANVAVLEARRQSGYVRQCHGDLHLGNICLYKGRPTLFDAIEFREDFSHIDVLYDIAFPIVDLLRYDKPMLANLLMNRYLEVTGDYSGLSLLPLFLSMRGMVRAMVHALEAQRNSARDTQAALACKYFDKAVELIEPQEPKLVAFGGYSGSGKSSIARRLAVEYTKEPGAIILRSDAVRKRLFQHAIHVPLPKSAYTEEINTRVYRAMFRDAHRALTAGRVVFVDATFIDPDRRDIIGSFANRKGVPFSGVWLEAPKEVLIARVNARTGDVSDATSDVVKRQVERSVDPINWARIDTRGDFETTIHNTLAVLHS